METKITKRVGAGWRNWMKCSRVQVCDRRMPAKLKGTRAEGPQNIDQVNDAICGGNLGYNEATRKTD